MALSIQHVAEQKENAIKDRGQRSDVQNCLHIYVCNTKFRKQNVYFCFDVLFFFSLPNDERISHLFALRTGN